MLQTLGGAPRGALVEPATEEQNTDAGSQLEVDGKVPAHEAIPEQGGLAAAGATLPSVAAVTSGEEYFGKPTECEADSASPGVPPGQQAKPAAKEASDRLDGALAFEMGSKAAENTTSGSRWCFEADEIEDEEESVKGGQEKFEQPTGLLASSRPPEQQQARAAKFVASIAFGPILGFVGEAGELWRLTLG